MALLKVASGKWSCGNCCVVAVYLFIYLFSEPFAKAVAQKHQVVLRAKPSTNFSTVQGRPHVLLCCAGQQDLLLVGTAAYTLIFGEKNKKESMAMGSWKQLVSHQLCTTR